MAKDVVMGMLREHLEKWVEGVDKKQVDLQTFKGELSLSKLKLKSTEFEAWFEEKFGLRVQLIEGSIGHLRASWTWSNLLTTPVSFEVRNVQLRIEALSADVADRILRPSHSTIDHTSKKSTVVAGKNTKGPMAFLKRAAGAVAAKVARPKVDKVRRRVVEQITDRLMLTMISVRLGVQLANTAVCGIVFKYGKTTGLEPGEGEVQHQTLELENLGFYINELEFDHCERIVDANPPPKFVLNPTSVNAEFVRTSGRRLNDIRGSNLNILVQDLDLAWSDEQFDALISGLAVARAWQVRIPRPGAQSSEADADFGEFTKDLCEGDAAKLLSSETPLSEDAELVASVTLARCRMLIGMEIGEPIARIEFDNAVEFTFNVTEHQRRGNCIVKNLEVLHSDERGLRAHERSHALMSGVDTGERSSMTQSLFIAPRGGSAPAFEASFWQDVGGTPWISVNIAAAEVRLLPGWIRITKTMRAALEHVLYFKDQLEKQSTRERPNLEIKVQKSCYILPAHYHDLKLVALRISCELGILSTSVDDDRFISLQNCSTEFIKEEQREHLFKELTVNVSRKKVHRHDSYEVKVPPVMLAITLAQFEGISMALSAARWMIEDHGDMVQFGYAEREPTARSSNYNVNATTSNVIANVCHVKEVKVQLSQPRVCLVDSEGLASHLAVTLHAVSVDAQWTFKEEDDEGFVKIAGFSIATGSVIGLEVAVLLEKNDVDLRVKESMVWKSKQLFLRTSVYRLHVLKLFSHSLHRSLGQAGLLSSGGNRSETARALFVDVERVILVLDDPDGFSGYLATSMKINGFSAKKMKGRANVYDTAFDYCNVQVCRSEDGYSDNNAAWLSLLRISGNPSQRATVTFGSSISVSASISVLPGPQMDDESFGESASPAFRTDSSQCYGSLYDRRLKGKLLVGTFGLNTTDAFVKELAEILGQLNGGLRAVVQSMSMVFYGRKHGLKMKGCEVEKASGEAATGGFAAGSVILTVGGHQVMPDDDVQGLLKSGKLPLPVQFIKPQTQQEDLAVDITLAPILIQVEYFKTANGRIVRDLEVQLGEVSLNGWKGSPSKLVKDLSQRYAVELAKRMPWASESIKAATSIVGTTAAKAFNSIHSKVASSLSLGVGSLPDATELTLGLAETALTRGRQVGDFAVGVFSWWGLTGDASSPSVSPNTGRAKTLQIPGDKASPKCFSTHCQSRAADRSRQSTPSRKPLGCTPPPRKEKLKEGRAKLKEEEDAQEDVKTRSSRAPKAKRKPKPKQRSRSVPSSAQSPHSPQSPKVRSTTSSWAAPDAFFDENEYDAEVSEIVQTPQRSPWDTSSDSDS